MKPTPEQIAATVRAAHPRGRAKKPSADADAALQQRLLGAAAEHPTQEAVATAIGWSVTALEVFLSERPDFAARYEALRARLTGGATPEPAAPAGFAWTDEIRRRLLTAYVDTGDLLEAQRTVGCTPSQFNDETRVNGKFAEAVKAATRDAERTLALRARSEALAGNDRLMALVIKNQDGDTQDLSRLTDQQIAARIIALQARVRERLKAAGILADTTPQTAPQSA